MPLKAAAFMLVLAFALTSQAKAQTSQSSAQPPGAIASTSLCGDGYVLALAPERAAALSWQSRDALSMAGATQKRLPQISDDPERLAASPANFTVFGPGEGVASAPVLAKKGAGSFTIVWGEDFAAVTDNLRNLGRALNMQARGEGISAGFDTRLANLKRRTAKRKTRPRILYLSRSGATAGPGTYVDAAIMAAGATNAVTKPGWQSPDVETLVSVKTDFILTSFFKEGYESAQAAPLRHRALRRYMARHESLDVPGRLWPCAGPHLITAAETIASGLDKALGAQDMKARP